MLEAQLHDQMDRLNELQNIVTAIQETQPRGFCYPRMVELVEELHTTQEQILDAR